MKQDIQIFVFSIQNAGNEPEAILTRTTGSYCFENGFHKINYCELDEDGNATDNLLLLSETEMRLSKSGGIAGEFLFISGQKTEVDYITPFGKIIFGVETEIYNLEVKEDCPSVKLKYRLYTEGRLFSENTLTIQICNNSDSGPRSSQ